MAWREGFVRTFLERDIPQLGITIPAAAMRRFWTMLAHWHGQTWNASELGRAMSLTDKTVRRYLDLLTGTYMVRQLQPWFENVAKRQPRAENGPRGLITTPSSAGNSGRATPSLRFRLPPPQAESRPPRTTSPPRLRWQCFAPPFGLVSLRP